MKYHRWVLLSVAKERNKKVPLFCRSITSPILLTPPSTGCALRALRDVGGRYIDNHEDILRLRWEVSMSKPEDGGSCVIC
jgi:hypothetical protein